MDWTPLFERLREVLEEGLGSVRTIAAGTLKGDLPPGLDLAHEQRRTFETPRVESSIKRRRPHVSSPVSANSNFAILELDLEIRLVYHAPRSAQIDDDERDAFRGAQLGDCDAIRQALISGNLTATDAGDATGVISSRVIFIDDELVSESYASDALRAEWRLSYTAIVQVAQA